MTRRNITLYQKNRPEKGWRWCAIASSPCFSVSTEEESRSEALRLAIQKLDMMERGHLSRRNDRLWR